MRAFRLLVGSCQRSLSQMRNRWNAEACTRSGFALLARRQSFIAHPRRTQAQHQCPVAGLSLSVLIVVCGTAMAESVTAHPPLGLPALPVLSAVPPELLTLGSRLFFDRRLSADGSVSCATCHIPEKAFSDNRSLAQGNGDAMGTRNTPSLLNVAYQRSLFWDGRRQSLEQQAGDPLFNPREHGLANVQTLIQIVESEPAYQSVIASSLGTNRPDQIVGQLAKALAAFERTLIAGDSLFDRYYYGGEATALSPAAQRGFVLFAGRAQCVTCHSLGPEGTLFTDGEYHSTGVGTRTIAGTALGALSLRVASASSSERDAMLAIDSDVAALGRFVVTRKPADIGKYKTPSLRNVALTAPYMHDGSVATLVDAVNVELYYRSLQSPRPVILTDEEKFDLVAFLRSLTSESWPLKREAMNSEPTSH